MSTLRIRVVVVGISTAGIRAAKTVAELSKKGFPNLQVTLIDKNDFHYHIIGAPRAMVDAEFGKKLLFPLKDLLKDCELDPEYPRHRFIKAALEAVNSDNTLKLSTGEIIPFDYLVLSTGTMGPHPSKLRSSSYEDAERELHRLHDEIGKAKSVLIIGGGPVGVETAGEIATTYPSKKVTLVHQGTRLLPANIKSGVGEGAATKLRKAGVKVVLKETIEIPPGVEFNNVVRSLGMRSAEGNWYDSDLQILATGSWPLTDYMSALESQTATKLRDGNGWIKIKPTLQLDSEWFPHIFVAGDANNHPYTAKYAIKAAQQGNTAGENIIKLIHAEFTDYSYQGGRAGRSMELKEWKDQFTAILVPVGKDMGVIQMLGMSMGGSGLPNVMER
ncbi:FAD/NAD(P)-binding domain-containing protein [Martensiomyces pterosporus]|nr:FAD/NAD(P)-binding domain-containing protein [Martensiomyces pterosporus]